MPVIGSIFDIVLIASGMAGWIALGVLWFRQRRHARQIARIVPTMEGGVAYAARVMLDTQGAAIDNPSALSFERKRREADALRSKPFDAACLCANTGRTCETCAPG